MKPCACANSWRLCGHPTRIPHFHCSEFNLLLQNSERLGAQAEAVCLPLQHVKSQSQADRGAAMGKDRFGRGTLIMPWPDFSIPGDSRLGRVYFPRRTPPEGSSSARRKGLPLQRLCREKDRPSCIFPRPAESVPASPGRARPSELVNILVCCKVFLVLFHRGRQVPPDKSTQQSSKESNNGRLRPEIDGCLIVP